MLGTYAGVRIVRSATGLHNQDEQLEEIIHNEYNPRQLVAVYVNRNRTLPDSRMGGIFVRDSRIENVARQRLQSRMDDAMVIVNRPNRNTGSHDDVNCMNNFPVPTGHKIHKNFNRLTHYIEEANVGRGFIKELCYSNDGRIICSPFSHGVRLLSFSPKCEELSTLQPKLPAVKLHEIGTNVAHTNIVLCTKFSPVHPLLVSGCLNGRIVWYQPRV